MGNAIVDRHARRDAFVSDAIAVLRTEAQAVADLVPRIGDAFVAACERILACKGRVIVSGIGKSGHVARKIAATLASTGTPAFFLHPAEASHGDLGMVLAEDILLALSNSGTTAEILAIVPLIKRRGAGLIAMTGDATSALAEHADIHLDVAVAQEACPHNLAPTASTTAALALGDALAVSLLQARGFGPEDFAHSHPGGALGRRLLTFVSDVMRTGEAVPSVPAGSRLSDALLEVSRKRMGMTAVINSADRTLAGIFTDGDLRRVLEKALDMRTLLVDAVMTREPVTIGPDVLAVEAVRIMEERRIGQLLVVDASRHVVGALHIHDLLVAKVA